MIYRQKIHDDVRVLNVCVYVLFVFLKIPGWGKEFQDWRLKTGKMWQSWFHHFTYHLVPGLW